jgi:hypothetical protein
MRVDDFRIIGAIGERIRVEVRPRGTIHHVLYDLDEQTKPLAPNEAILTNLVRERKELPLKFSFPELEGGAYEIRVIGTRGLPEGFSTQRSQRPRREFS